MTIKIKQISSKLDKEINLFEPGQKLAGIDIGSTLIKIAVLKEAPVGTRLLSLALTKIPTPEEADGTESLEKRITIALHTALSQLKVKAQNVAIIINVPSLNIKNLALPQMPYNELKESVKWEMEQNIDYTAEEATIDFLTSGETIRAGAKNLELEVVSAKTEEIKEYMQRYGQYNLKIKSINVSPFCLWNVFQKSNQWKEDDTIALVDIGAKTTQINIFNNNILKFTREVFFGGDTITENLAQQQDISLAEAEEARTKYGLSDNSAYSEAITNILKELTSEIERSFGYYKGQFHIDRIDRLVLYGGASQLINLDKFLSEELSIFAEVGVPFNGLLFDHKSFVNLDEFTSFFTLAIGAAIVSGDAKKINLLPLEFRKDNKLAVKSFLIKFIPALSIFILFFLYVNIINVEKNLTKEKIEKEEILETWKSEQGLKAKLDFLDSLQTTKKSWVESLEGIRQAIPEQVWLNSFEINEKNKIVTLNGAAESNILVIEFVRKLEKSPYFTSVDLESVEEAAGQAKLRIYFKITILKK